MSNQPKQQALRVTPHEAVEHIKDCMGAKLVPMLSGSPGIGKSDIMDQVFTFFNLQKIDIRLSHYDPTEMNGVITKRGERGAHLPMETFPLEGDEIPAGKDGWGIAFDEFNSAAQMTQAAAYKVILDRLIGQTPLHKRVAMICAGNLASDGAIVNRQSTAMQSRLIHLELTVDVEQWVQWANRNQLDHRVIAYIQQVPDNLHKFDPEHNDKTFACPRTWEFLAKLIRNTSGSLQPKLPLLAGTVGEPIAREFILYSDIYTDMPTMADILRDPSKIEISREPGVLYALSNMVAAWAKEENIKNVMPFITRLPIEFGTVTLQNLLHRKPDMYTNDTILKWVDQYAPGLF